MDPEKWSRDSPSVWGDLVLAVSLNEPASSEHLPSCIDAAKRLIPAGVIEMIGSNDQVTAQLGFDGAASTFEVTISA
jgi:hypothetical protein